MVRVNCAYTNDVGRSLQDQAGRESSASGPSDAVTGGGDKVHLSALSVQLQTLREAVDCAEGARAERVREVHESILSGDYSVDSREVAESFLREMMLS